MHFPMRCLRSDSQWAGRAAVTGALGEAVEVDERRHGEHVARQKDVESGLMQSGRICGRGIV